MLKNIVIAFMVSIILPFYTKIAYIMKYGSETEVIENESYDITSLFNSFDINEGNVIESNIESSIIYKNFN